ncbi:60S ribosomal protein L3 [Microdochium bolleyi]|uniref:Large ribosomal subunit protein mL44 n=1 Tax=Microdochium bolleyi TaxID=196109 RepID=A0A136IKN2_9PEZI|nr:60S ribosomal protein L3 [Microdochium bolleyi]
MKRIRTTRAPCSLLRARASQAASRTFLQTQARCQSTEAVQPEPTHDLHAVTAVLSQSLPSPHPDRALRSAKLAALHARLYLSSKVPHQTLARCLVDPSADAHPNFNNANLAYLGGTVLQYHTSEWLISHYPRLPMTILFSAMKGYAGVPALYQVARAWGVEQAYAPGGEVDPGLLQFTDKKPTVQVNKWGYARGESKELLKYKWRRGMSSRVLYDDAFGDMLSEGEPVAAEQQGLEVSGAKNTKDILVQDPKKNAHANMVRAVIGAIYLHHGRDAAHDFVKAHVLSRKLDLSNLFEFKLPTRELARLCAREDFEAPVARMLNETGRLSRTPVFVVGIFSGRDKLGEGSGPSLDSARVAAAINALKSWYLYSPGDRVPVPSDTFLEDAPAWKPAYVDIGEIIS